MAAGYFSLLAQREVTKRKAPSDPRRSRSERFAAGERVRPTGHPWPVVRIGAIHRAARVRCTRLFRSPFAAAQRGPRSCPHPSPLPQAGEGTRCVGHDGSNRFCGRDCRALLFPGPSRPRRAGAGSVAKRWPAGCRPVRREHMDVLPANPGACSRSHARRDARVTADARVSFSWLLLFGQAKRSNRRPWMADDPHTDVSRSSRQRRKPKSKVKMDSGLRRNDERSGFRPSPEPRMCGHHQNHRRTKKNNARAQRRNPPLSPRARRHLALGEHPRRPPRRRGFGHVRATARSTSPGPAGACSSDRCC